MHIPDGYLSPQTYAPFYGAAMIFWAAAMKKLKKELATRQVPYVAMAAAFTFLIQMFNIPAPGGTTGHAAGSAIVAILLGPWTAVIAISVVLVIQALVFGDGGITAIGANCFNLAIAMPFISYGVFRMISGKVRSGRRIFVAAFFSGYLGLCSAAVLTAIELGVQPLIAQTADGTPLYAPYPLKITVPVMALEHLFLFGIVEGMVTGLLLAYTMKHEPGMVYAVQAERGRT